MMGDDGQADEEPGCWGSFIKNDGGKSCDPNFVRGRRHMKNKFCWYCTDGDLYVESARVLGLPEELHDAVINSSKGGVWSTCEETFGTEDRFRVINNTAGCRSPRLIIWERSIPSLPNGLQWVPMPPEWSVDGYMHLSVSRGTLVPTKPPAGPRKQQRQQARRDEANALARSAHTLGHSHPHMMPHNQPPNGPYGAHPSQPIYHPGGALQLPPGAGQFVCVMPGHMAPHGGGMTAYIPAQYGVPPSAPGQPHPYPPPLHHAHPPSHGPYPGAPPGAPADHYHPPPPAASAPPPSTSAAAAMHPSDMGMGALAEAAACLGSLCEAPSAPPGGGAYYHHQAAAPPPPHAAPQGPPPPAPEGASAYDHAQAAQAAQAAHAAPAAPAAPAPYVISPFPPAQAAGVHAAPPPTGPPPPQPPFPPLEAVVSSAVGLEPPEAPPTSAGDPEVPTRPNANGSVAPAPGAPSANSREPEEAEAAAAAAAAAVAVPGGIGTFKRPLPMEEMLQATKREKKAETERMLMQKFEKLQARLSQRSERAAEGSSDDSSNNKEEVPTRTSIQLSIVEQLCSLIEDADAAKLKRVNAALSEIVSNDVSTATEYGETEVDEA